MIKNWCRKVLEALQYLHERDIIHGELTCESIYINSNNGEVKIGDVGIKHIHAKMRTHELGLSKQFLREQDTMKVDVYCFGLTLLEMLTSEKAQERRTLRYIIRILNRGCKQRILNVFLNERLRDFLATATDEDPNSRLDVRRLRQHAFLQEEDAADCKEVRTTSELGTLIDEQISHF